MCASKRSILEFLLAEPDRPLACLSFEGEGAVSFHGSAPLRSKMSGRSFGYAWVSTDD